MRQGDGSVVRKQGGAHLKKTLQKRLKRSALVPATPWDEPRTKGLRTEGYSILRGHRQKLLQVAYKRGASEAELWEAAHSTSEHFTTPGWWWHDPEYRITSCGRRETPCPAHGWANLMYWLTHGRGYLPGGGVPFEEGSVPSFFLRSQSVTSNARAQ